MNIQAQSVAYAQIGRRKPRYNQNQLWGNREGGLLFGYDAGQFINCICEPYMDPTFRF